MNTNDASEDRSAASAESVTRGAARAIPTLMNGGTVRFAPHGRSMSPIIEDGQMVEVSPNISNLAAGDVVLCLVEGRVLLHSISRLYDGLVQISNARGHVNGWTTRRHIFGRVTKVES